ncbi:early nodulin-like protein 14 [Typha angustifolia]|uniref:early nodulin-like protein 14 n=1 Tax=Typha angustifolia TaxID=59011 RepID=UPI003C2F79FF
MESWPLLLLLLLSPLLFFHSSQALEMVVASDHLSKWKDPTLLIGDSIVFKKEELHSLYLFHSKNAFNSCNFAQATILHNGDSTHFKWRPARPGYYYLGTKRCESGEKVPLRVVVPDPSTEASPAAAPPPIAGGDLPTIPSNGWFSSSPIYSAGPTMSFNPLLPVEGPAPATEPSSSGVPLISSNPAVPLPTGITDTATILPLPTGDENKVVGMASWSRVRLSSVVFLIVLTFWSSG